MQAGRFLLVLATGGLLAEVSHAYDFPMRPLTANALTKNSLTMSGAVAGWVSCVPDPIDEWDPLTCEIWVHDANGSGPAQAITDNAVEDECVAIHGRDVVFRRGIGAGQVVLRDLDAGETILSAAGVDSVFYACPLISAARVVWLRGGQVVVHDRVADTARVVGSNASYPHLDGDYVVWQEGEEDASEVWLLDASSPESTPQRLTDDAVPDERPTVTAVRGLAGTYPVVSWTTYAGGSSRILAWSGSTTTITPVAGRSHYFPQVTSYATSFFLYEQAVIAWDATGPLALLYCTQCNGDPANVLGLPASDPFLAGSPYTALEAISGGWMVFRRIFPHPVSQFDIAFFEIDGAVVTPITDDAALDDAAVLGFRSVPPVGPVVVWRRSGETGSQIFHAPEPAAAPLVALLALGAARARRARSARA